MLRFGNAPPVNGLEAIRALIDGVFASVASLKHGIQQVWEIPGGAVVHGTVSYERHDRSVLSVPFCNVFKFCDGGISDYRVFVDASEL